MLACSADDPADDVADGKITGLKLGEILLEINYANDILDR